jgi:hypothetical protein
MSKMRQPASSEPPAALFDRVATILEQARGNVVRVVNTEFFRAKGAPYESLGQRPRFAGRQHDSALKGRHNYRYHWVALSGLEWIDTIIPRALPWASMDRPVGAGMIEANMEVQADV